ncbi:hypothetical protein NGA_0470800, partial [Nannochloropsis gaditana CCMP526]|uniref:uncharacterized protein n=1 Tax=Nannochloropsis gaditana (strain CCMP526) TaxID=1093141 RepID=UPI00029F73C7
LCCCLKGQSVRARRGSCTSSKLLLLRYRFLRLLKLFDHSNDQKGCITSEQRTCHAENALSEPLLGTYRARAWNAGAPRKKRQ